jgi:hypothetical protein
MRCWGRVRRRVGYTPSVDEGEKGRLERAGLRRRGFTPGVEEGEGGEGDRDGRVMEEMKRLLWLLGYISTGRVVSKVEFGC